MGLRRLAIYLACFLGPIAQLWAYPGSHFPTLVFEEGYRFSMTQLCLDQGHLRPFQPLREFCQLRDDHGHRLGLRECPAEAIETILLKRPVTEMKRFDLGDERFLTRVDRIQTRHIALIGPYLEVEESTSRYNVPNCPNSLVHAEAQLIQERTPSLQEQVIYTALFKDGITHIRQESLQEANSSLFHDVVAMSDERFVLRFGAPQCQQGKIELSEDFVQYLAHPSAIDFLFRRIGGEGSGSGRLHPRLPLRLIGGEGSGSGRIVFGGEGSGSGRALEGRRIDPLAPSSGELRVTVKMSWADFQNQAMAQDLLRALLEDEQDGQDVISIECR